MTTPTTIRICPCDDLRTQSGLHPLLEVMVAGGLSHSLSSGGPEQVVILDRSGGEVACLGASLDAERIAMLGPILAHAPLETVERRNIWQTAIDWARSQKPAAIQLACDATTSDCEILADLGFPITTQIGSFECDDVPWMISDDAQMKLCPLDVSSEELVQLVQRTLIESLDIPEAIPYRSPRRMIEGWIEEGETRTWVAQSPAGPVGLLVSYQRENAAEISYIGVISGQRRRGWGTRLFGQFLKWAKDAGVTRISVIVDRRNSPAIQLYRRFGFHEAEVWMPVVFHPLSPA